METKTIRINIRGVAPLLMKAWTGEKPSGIRFKVKTEDTIKAKNKAEWLDALYVKDGYIAIPGDNLQAMISKGGAAKLRRREQFESGFVRLLKFVALEDALDMLELSDVKRLMETQW